MSIKQRKSSPSHKLNSSITSPLHVGGNEVKRRRPRISKCCRIPKVTKVFLLVVVLLVFFMLCPSSMVGIWFVKYNKLHYTPTQRPHTPPRKMSESKNPVYFLHIGKAGGTSVDLLMTKILRRKRRRYSGHKHYDWSWIERRGDPDKNADVITFLREPVSRAVSQFYFSKKLPWAKHQNATFLHQTLDEYLMHPGGWRQPIHDGAGGVSYLAGTAKGEGWIASDGKDTDLKQYLRSNMTANAYQAARNLDRTVYFGLLEDIPRSMKMLQITLNLQKAPKFPQTNSARDNRRRRRRRRNDDGNENGNENGNDGNERHTNSNVDGISAAHQQISAETTSMIESYIPGDLWLYQYAKLLFEARWNYLTGQTDHYEHPELPPLPESLRVL